jgi:hypothetical protein
LRPQPVFISDTSENVQVRLVVVALLALSLSDRKYA